MQKNIDLLKSFKEIDPSTLQWIATIVVFIGGVILFTKFSKKITNPILSFLLFYFAIAAMSVIIDLVQQNISLGIIPIIKGFLGYCTLMFLKLLYIGLTLPIILFYLISGPFMIGLAVVSLAMILAYFFEVILKIDLKFVNAPAIPGSQALIWLAAFIVSTTTLIFYKKTEYIFNLGIVKLAELMEYVSKVLL